MKLNKIIFGATWALALLLGVSSCSEEWEPAELPNNAQVCFSNENITEFLLEENQSEVRVEVSRLDTNGELSVGLIANDTTEAKLFTIPESVTFADGEATATFPITFEFSDLVPDNGYALDINLAGEFTEYADAGVKVVIKYAPWSDWTPYGWEYTENATGEPNYSAFKEWEADYAEYAAGGYADATLEAKLYAEEMPTYQYKFLTGGVYIQTLFYRESMLDPTQAQFMLYDWGRGANIVIDWDKKANSLMVLPQETGAQGNNGAIMMIDTYYCFTEVFNAPSYTEGQVPSRIVEDKGQIILNIAYVTMAGSLYGYGEETIQLPGYEQPDYSLGIKDLGTFVYGTSNLSQIITMTFGADVSSVKYAWFEGDLDVEVAADAIFSGEVESVLTKEGGNKVIPVEAEGTYTLVAVIFNADGERVGQQYIQFTAENPKTWSDVATGTYTHSLLYQNPIVQDGLTLCVCDQDPSLYKIEGWGVGIDFIFTMNEDNTLAVAAQPVGVPYQGEDIMVSDLVAYTGDSENFSSGFYDNGTFFFNLVYYVSRGEFGYGTETFELSVDSESRNVTPMSIEDRDWSVSRFEVSNGLPSVKHSRKMFDKTIKGSFANKVLLTL